MPGLINYCSMVFFHQDGICQNVAASLFFVNWMEDEIVQHLCPIRCALALQWIWVCITMITQSCVSINSGK
jgi:hypothetical protein